jgi:hypothetical protein
VGPEQHLDQHYQSPVSKDPISGIALPLFPKPLIVPVTGASRDQLLNSLTPNPPTVDPEGMQGQSNAEQRISHGTVVELAKEGRHTSNDASAKAGNETSDIEPQVLGILRLIADENLDGEQELIKKYRQGDEDLRSYCDELMNDPQSFDGDVPYYIAAKAFREEDEAGNINYYTLFDDRESPIPTWRMLLRKMLTPFLAEYPFMKDDIELLKELDKRLNEPLDIPIYIGSGTTDAFDEEAIDGERKRQIHEILERAKLAHDQASWHNY